MHLPAPQIDAGQEGDSGNGSPRVRWLDALSRRESRPMTHLKCLRCGAEWPVSELHDLCDRIGCLTCSAEFEFRQLREEWCVGRRHVIELTRKDE